jgi:hypothetical protein
MVSIAHRNPAPRAGDTPVGKMLGYLSETQTWLKYEAFAEGVRAVWVLDFFPLSLIEDVLVRIVQWAYDNVFQNSYNAGADRGNEINKEILGWVENLRSEAENWLNDHEKRIKNLEEQLGLLIVIPDFLKNFGL